MLKIENMIGIEAEFIILDKKGRIVIPESNIPRDDFILLGEVRGEPGRNVYETLLNFEKAKEDVLKKIPKNHTIKFLPIEYISHEMYKEVIQKSNIKKNDKYNKVLNIRNINIDNLTDQVSENGNIKKWKISCGLHIHFSSIIKKEIIDKKYKRISIPISIPVSTISNKDLIYLDDYILYKFEKEEKVTIKISLLNKILIKEIVKMLDKRVYSKFKLPEEKQTKYRKPGYFEIKEYGFEYRSLQADDNTMNNLKYIIDKSFDILNRITEYY